MRLERTDLGTPRHLEPVIGANPDPGPAGRKIHWWTLQPLITFRSMSAIVFGSAGRWDTGRRARRWLTAITVCCLDAPEVRAEPPPGPSDSQPAKAKRPAEGIMDNSFLIEEAYNQEPGVVQHIFTARFGVDHHPGDQDRSWDLSFTQEWPVFSQTHQLSYTIPYSFVDPPDAEHDSGLGDIALNYRYQLLDGTDGGPAVAPRLSLLLPSGDDERGFGTGALGYQFNLPLSQLLNDRLTLHANAGLTYVPQAELIFDDGTDSDERDLISYNLGASLIYAVSDGFNVLVELLWNSDQSLEERSTYRGRRAFVDRTRTEDVVLSPGIRWAHNLESGVQIVPGIALPIGLSDDAIDYGVFFYLSIEHGFLPTGH